VFSTIVIRPDPLDLDFLDHFGSFCDRYPHLPIKILKIQDSPTVAAEDLDRLYQLLAVTFHLLRRQGTVQEIVGIFSLDLVRTVRGFLCRLDTPLPHFTINHPIWFGTQLSYDMIRATIASSGIQSLRIHIPLQCEAKDRSIRRRLVLDGITTLHIDVNVTRIPDFFLQIVAANVQTLVISLSLDGAVAARLLNRRREAAEWPTDKDWNVWVPSICSNTACVWRTSSNPLDLHVEFHAGTPACRTMSDLQQQLANQATHMWAEHIVRERKNLGTRTP
jgi:hypothetical protein